uniref:Uncharacterized protein n=1 Tax=Arundo donax TaxID=35708 RepID=A0A0A9GY72_ARUDO
MQGLGWFLHISIRLMKHYLLVKGVPGRQAEDVVVLWAHGGGSGPSVFGTLDLIIGS